MYKGLAIPEMLPNPEETLRELSALPQIELQSWRKAPTLKSYLWTVRPPGTWVVLMRIDEHVVTSSPHVPLHYDVGPDSAMEEVRWDKIYSMLGVHKAALLCRLSPDSGLMIAVASARPDGPWLPLMPGYKVTIEGTVPDALDTALRQNLEQLAKDAHNWPEGLSEPSVVHMSSIQTLADAENREYWLNKHPEGLWLLSVQEGRMNIFEVLS